MQRVLLNQGLVAPLVHVIAAQTSRSTCRNMLSASCRFGGPVRQLLYAKATDMSLKGKIARKQMADPASLAL